MKIYYDMDAVKVRVGRTYATRGYDKKYKILKSNKKTGVTVYYDYWDKMIRTGSRIQFVFDIAHKRIVLLKEKEKPTVKARSKPLQRAYKGSKLNDKPKRVVR